MKRTKLVGCVIRNDSGHILLLHRYAKRIQWELPGGKLEVGELAEDAAVREFKEELGIDIAVGNRLGQAFFIRDDREMDYVWYDATIVTGDPIVCEPDLFDQVRFWDITLLGGRSDLSANIQNLLASGMLGTPPVSRSLDAADFNPA